MAATILVLVLPVGCREDLTVAEFKDAPFSIYGVLSPQLDTQTVRVYPLEAVPSLGSPRALKAQVYSIDMETGQRRMWRDSVVVGSQGQFGHVFWAPFRAEFGRVYRIEAVRGTDGATTHANVPVPPRVAVRIDESDAPRLHVIIEGGDVRPTKSKAVYVVGQDAAAIRFNISYQGTEQRIEGGWQVTYNMIVDYDFIRFQLSCGPYCGCRPRLFELKLNALIGDGSWDPPAGVFDPNVLAVGRTMSNVENGFGFIGGGYVLEESLYPSSETIDRACFTDALRKHAP